MMYDARALKQKRLWLRGAAIIRPARVASLRGWVMMSRDRWTARLSSAPWMALFLMGNLGHGKRAMRTNAWLEDFIRTSMRMFARLRRTEWATLSPVMTEMFILSDERVTPRRVASSGRHWVQGRISVARLLWRTIRIIPQLCVHTQKHFFTRVELSYKENLGSWKRMFPDPSISPAHFAKSLHVKCVCTVTVTNAEVGGWRCRMSTSHFSCYLFAVYLCLCLFVCACICPSCFGPFSFSCSSVLCS